MWESLIVSARHQLSNLTVIVERNDGVLNGLADKFHSFGWATACADGHDMCSLDGAFRSLPDHYLRLLIAKTLRGKGIPSLEQETALEHETVPPTADDLLKELEGHNNAGTEKKPGRGL